jgi:hypothetical protein
MWAACPSNGESILPGQDIITAQDLQTQLFTLNEQERLLRRDLADARLLVSGHAAALTIGSAIPGAGEDWL